MNRRWLSVCGLALALVAPTCVTAQTVHPRVKVSTGCLFSAASNWETAIVASPLHPSEVLVAWIADFSVRYAISLDGGAHFTCPQLWLFNFGFPCVGEELGDPMVAASYATGDLYVGAIGTGWFIVGRKPLGYAGPVAVVQASPCEANGDKGFLAAGPRPHGAAAEDMYLLYKSSTNRPVRARSKPVNPVGSQWPLTSSEPGFALDVRPGGATTTGHAPFPVVLQGGRVAVAYARFSSNLVVAPPAVTFSDDGGDDVNGLSSWSAAAVLNQWQMAGQFISDVKPPAGSTAPIVPGMGSGFPYTLPSVAVNPNDTRNVFVLFCGRTSDSSRNVDLFIAQSTIEPVSDRLVFLPQNTFRIDDAQLRLATDPHPNQESDEWMPSIVVDAQGGINILFWRTDDSDLLPGGAPGPTTRPMRTCAMRAGRASPPWPRALPRSCGTFRRWSTRATSASTT